MTEKIKPVRQVFASYDLSTSSLEYPTSRYCSRCGSRNDSVEQDGSTRFICSSCGNVSYRNPLPGVSVLVEHQGMVLLGRRGGGSFAGGTWCLPCGFVEHDEDVLTAAKREVLEETGLTIELLSIIQVTSNFLSPDLHSVVTVFHARVKSGHPRPGDDIDKVEWFQLNGPFPPFAFEADREIIERFSLASKPGLSLEESLR